MQGSTAIPITPHLGTLPKCLSPLPDPTWPTFCLLVSPVIYLNHIANLSTSPPQWTQPQHLSVDLCCVFPAPTLCPAIHSLTALTVLLEVRTG